MGAVVVEGRVLTENLGIEPAAKLPVAVRKTMKGLQKPMVDQVNNGHPPPPPASEEALAVWASLTLTPSRVVQVLAVSGGQLTSSIYLDKVEKVAVYYKSKLTLLVIAALVVLSGIAAWLELKNADYATYGLIAGLGFVMGYIMSRTAVLEISAAGNSMAASLRSTKGSLAAANGFLRRTHQEIARIRSL